MRALLLDFNGTLSEDEPLLCRIFQELFAEAGKPLTEADYYDRLAGYADRELVRLWLGHDDPSLVARKTARYRELADGSTVSDETRSAVREAAGLVDVITLIVSADDISRSKPDPEGYLIALHLLGVGPMDAAAIEDSEAGVAAAKAAGVYCVAVTTTLPPDRLTAADALADRVDRELIARLVSAS